MQRNGLGFPPQSQTRTTQAELLKVRRGVFRGSARLSRRHRCKGQIVHGGVHPRYGPLQPNIRGQGHGGWCGCGSRLWHTSSATGGERLGSGDGIHRWWVAGAVSDGSILFPSRYPACNATSGCECPCSTAAAYSCEAKAGPSLKEDCYPRKCTISHSTSIFALIEIGVCLRLLCCGALVVQGEQSLQ